MAIDKHGWKWIVQHAPSPSKRIITLGHQHWCVCKFSGNFAEKYFKSFFGAETVDSMDCSPDESPTIIHDLNLPYDCKEKYDLVFDGGTIEHVFDPLQALDNAANMTKIGGVFISHQLINFTGHGFWQLSPELLHKWSVTRGFGMQQCMIYRLGPKPRYHYVRLRGGNRIEISSVVPMNMLFCAQKMREGTYRNPTQAKPSLTHPLKFWLHEVRAWAK